MISTNVMQQSWRSRSLDFIQYSRSLGRMSLSYLCNMSNNFDVWILVKQILCRQYISSKIKNVVSCQSMHNIVESSYDTRLVIYEGSAEGGEGYRQLGWWSWLEFLRVGALET